MKKAGVEGLVEYARRNYMVPVPENELYEREKHLLLNLPDIEFSNLQTSKNKSDKYSTVIIDKNRYSVPTEYAYLNLSAVLKINSIDLYYGNRKIAEHKRLYDVNQWRKTLPACYDHLLDH